MAHKSGFVNIIGHPNVGKSTLMNMLMGEKLSIITPKAQTTRHRILGIVNGEDYQIVYSDTPGIVRPHYKLHESMMKFVNTALQDADVFIYMTEAGESSFNTDKITAEVLRLLPENDPYFPKDDELSDRPLRFFISEMIREKIFLLYQQEIPYSAEVVVDSYKEKPEIVVISATIFVERDTQKAIILGHKGEAIKKLGTMARKDIEAFIDKKVYLELSLKVSSDWREDANQLKRFGYEF